MDPSLLVTGLILLALLAGAAWLARTVQLHQAVRQRCFDQVLPAQTRVVQVGRPPAQSQRSTTIVRLRLEVMSPDARRIG